MREVPITLQIKRASGLAACSEDGLLALPQLASEAEEQIISKYRPSPQYSSCKLVSLEHTSCESLGKIQLATSVDIACARNDRYTINDILCLLFLKTELVQDYGVFVVAFERLLAS